MPGDGRLPARAPHGIRQAGPGPQRAPSGGGRAFRKRGQHKLSSALPFDAFNCFSDFAKLKKTLLALF